MILVCGVHGSGKTWFSKMLSSKKEVPYYSASELIDKCYPLNHHQTKYTDSISLRQEILLNELAGLCENLDEFVLDGHLCLLNQEGSIEKVNVSILQSMHITKIIFLMASPELIYDRLKKRDGVIYDKNFIEEFQDEEYSYAQYISSVLGIELKVVNMNEIKDKMAILLSVKPTFSDSILKGIKKYEFRKRLCKSNINKIYLYTSFPIKKIVGEVHVESKMCLDKNELWSKTEQSAGIKKSIYMSYFQDSKTACAYELGKRISYSKGISLQEIDVVQAPQSFLYLSSKQQLLIQIALCSMNDEEEK